MDKSTHRSRDKLLTNILVPVVTAVSAMENKVPESKLLELTAGTSDLEGK